MAASINDNGKDRRKAVDADLNLVPYIDLLTCMVAFLLITAVWSQLARLSVDQKGQGQIDTLDTPPTTRIAVVVHADGFNLIVKDDQKPIPKRGTDLDYSRLVDELKEMKKAYPDKTDVQILSEDGVVFDTLVKTMDAAMTAGFPELALLDAGGGGR
jgi:biopolymer transport protein TolR